MKFPKTTYSRILFIWKFGKSIWSNKVTFYNTRLHRQEKQVLNRLTLFQKSPFSIQERANRITPPPPQISKEHIIVSIISICDIHCMFIIIYFEIISLIFLYRNLRLSGTIVEITVLKKWNLFFNSCGSSR